MNDRLSIQVADNISSYVDPLEIRRAVDETLNYTDSSPHTSLTIVFDGDELLHKMNKEFLGIDEPTDVLSFPMEFLDEETGMSYLGDVLISVPRALEQATAGNHTVKEELQLLVVHGILHLLGFDHQEETEKEHMQTAQSAILQRLGIKLEVSF